eukprot:scaffold227223_cov33-Tisochrysis_lutea.AAC.1
MVCYVAKNLSRDALCTLKVVYLGRTLESEDKGQRNEGGKRKRRGEEIRAMSSPSACVEGGARGA